MRRERDGFYYRGTVKEEIEVSDSCGAAVMWVCVIGCALSESNLFTCRKQLGHLLTSWVKSV